MGSYSQTIMKDQRLQLDQARIVAAPESILTVTEPGSVMVGAEAQVGDILIQEYTPEIQKTIAQVVGTFAETSQEVTETLGQKLLTTQQGVASILPEMAKYVAIAVVVIVVARKVWK